MLHRLHLSKRLCAEYYTSVRAPSHTTLPPGDITLKALPVLETDLRLNIDGQMFSWVVGWCHKVSTGVCSTPCAVMGKLADTIPPKGTSRWEE